MRPEGSVFSGKRLKRQHPYIMGLNKISALNSTSWRAEVSHKNNSLLLYCFPSNVDV
jgi:hypothetical protein